MARISFNQINSLPDALDGSAFELLLGTIPIAGSSVDLTLKCQTASIPGVTNEAFEVPVHGHVKKFRGRKTFTRALNVTYFEVADLSTYRSLKLWDEFITGTESGNSGGFQSAYSVQSSLVVYNTTGAIAGTFDFDNMFIQEIADVQLDGQSSQLLQVSATFSFDRMLVGGVPIL